MKIKGLICGLLFCLLSSTIYAGTTLNYDRGTAIDYAKKYCQNYNTDTDDTPDEAYEKFDNDCANFVSQVMIAGGLSFGCVKAADVIGTGKKNKGEKGEVTVRDRTDKGKTYNGLLTQLKENFCFEIITDPSKAQKGDILSSKTGSHVVIYSGEEKTIKEDPKTLRPAYYGHTQDRCNEATDRYDKWIIYRFQASDQCKKCERDEATCKAVLRGKCSPDECNKCEVWNAEKGICEPKKCGASAGCQPKVNCDTQTGKCITSQGGDCPDDTLTVGTGIPSQSVPSTSSTAPVGILEVGFTYDMYDLLQSFKEDARVIRPGDISPTLAKEMPLLIIPSAGLYGMENSSLFRTTVDEYVKQGGTVLVLSQQRGYEFSVLPGGLDGYGWTEDQSCQSNSSYIDTWHSILAGQTRSTPSISVDGYFTSYPENTTVLLRRTANGQPAVLMYPYGNGYVIASTIYTDTAYTRGEASEEERRLIRDIITWAKSPASLTEIRPGQTATVNLTVTNNDTFESATAVEIELYDPDGKEVKLRTKVPVILTPGQSTQVPVTYTTTATEPLGIYRVKYDLLTEGYQLLTSELDPQGTNVWLESLLQPPMEALSGRFAVSNPPRNPYKSPDFNFSIQSDAEYYMYGTHATFTVKGWNNTANDALITFKYSNPFGGGSWIYETRIFNVPARSSASFNIVVPELKGWRGGIRGIFYEETGWYVGYALKGIQVFDPSVYLTVQSNKGLYEKGETVTINTSLKNNIPVSWQSDVKITITDPQNIKVFEDTKAATLPLYDAVSTTSNFTLPLTLAIGTYTVRAEVWWGTRLVSSALTRFELPQSRISVAPNLPTTYASGANTIPFILNNTGKIGVSSGSLDVSLNDPDGAVIYTGAQPFALAVGESKTVDVPISIPSLKFGNYTFTYSQSDETRTGNAMNIIIPNSSAIDLSFDKFAVYRIKETANLIATVTNTGRFNLENIFLSVFVPDTGYTDTKTININQGQALPLQYAISIPDAITPGQHDAIVTLTLPSGSSIVQSSKFTVPESSLTIRYSEPSTITIGDTVNIDVANTGGVDTNFTYKVSLSGNNAAVYQNTINDAIQSGSTKTYSFRIPSQTTEGIYLFGAEALDARTNRVAGFSKAIFISGVSAGLSVKTDKDIYLSTENITALSQIVNQAYAIDNANLHLQIVNKCGWGEAASYHISTWDGASWVERGVLRYPNILDTRLIDLSAYLPDASGENKIRIRHEGIDDARIDYITLRADGVAYTPSSAISLITNDDILSAITDADSWTAYVLNNEIEIAWTSAPASINKIFLMRAQEGAIDYSACQERTYWQEDIPITQGANTTVDINRVVNPLYTTGQFYLQGTLTSRTGQVIAQAEYPFNVIDGDIALSLRTDKTIYRPGEAVTISGNIVNLAAIEADGITVEIRDNNGSTIYTGGFNIPANGAQAFTFTTTAGAAGVYQLYGEASQNGGYLTSVTDKYEVTLPVLTASASAPAIVSRSPFELGIAINNTGKVQVAIQLSATGGSLSDTQSITLQPNETRLIQYTQSITSDTTYTISIIGDLNQAITIPVIYGEGASIILNTQAVYPEGKIAVPVTITNTGQIDETLLITFSLQPSALTQTKSYYIQKGASATDTLYFDFTEGSYQLSAVSNQPSATATANFSVMKENKIDMAVSTGLQAAGLIPITVNLTNLGYNTIDGSVQLSVVSGQNAVVWNGEQSITQLATGNSQLVTFTINPSAIQAGNYTLRAELLNNSNQQLAQNTQPLAITGATFQITELPPYQTFNPGQEAQFIFKVKNTGNQEGAAELNFRAYDLIDATQRGWLMPNEEKTITFNFLMPTDLEEKDYFANYEMRAVSGQPSAISNGQVKYHLVGINLAVNASLDKQNYNIGDTARLTIAISNQQAASSNINLSAKANYAGYENQQAFTLNGSQTLTFDIPLTQITGEKLFYGIYHESGRSIHLNSLYIYKSGDVITITTNKQVYNLGEAVSISITGNATGQMTLSGPGGYTETFAFIGTATKGFTLSPIMAAGTYFINAELRTPNSELITAAHPIDVAGIQVKIKEAILDKAKYLSQDNMNLSLTIESNQNIPATLKAWVIDPEGRFAAVGEKNINLAFPENLLMTSDFSLLTSVSGIHRLFYGMYTGDILLASGSEAFDVGNAVLLGLSTNKADYGTNTEPVNVKASIYGTGAANLEIQIDGTTVKTEPVTLSGFTTLNIDIGTSIPGAHTIKGVLTTNGLTNTRQTNFVYGSNLPDLTTAISAQLLAITGTTMPVVITVMNQGKTPSAATTIVLYDGDTLIETKSVNALNSGEMQEITFNWNILGKTGVHNIKATVDPDNQVIEYNEQNNTATATITIPDITMNLATDSEAYKTNKNIGINTQITNLTASTNYSDLILNTEIRNPSGLTIYTKADTIALLPASSGTNYITAWNTESNLAGTYTIRQTITAGQITATKEKQITIEQTTELSGSITPDNTTIFKGKDLKADYAITNIGNTEINNQMLQITITDLTTKEVFKQVEIPFSLKIKEQIKGTATIAQIDLEPKDYNLNLTAIIDNATYTIATTAITVKLPLQVTKQIGTWPRVLVYIEDRHDKGQDEIKIKEQIANLLIAMNINHVIVTKEEDFIANFRIGKHNIYMIIEVRTEQDDHGAKGQGSENIGQQYIWKELTEAINNGEGLIYIKTHPDEKPDLRDVLGVKIKGEEKDAKQLILLESPITNTNTIDLTEEKTIEITLEKAKQVAYITAKHGMGRQEEDQLPAITINNYGLGKAILFAFNPIDNNSPILNQTIINAINYITPDAEKAETTTYSITPINNRIMNLGEEITLKITELLPEGIKLIEAYNPASTKPLTWEPTLKPNEAKDIRYIIQLPDKTGTYDITSRIEYQVNGSYKNYGDTILSLDIQRGFTKILQDDIDNINKLALTGEDLEKAEEVKELLNRVINRGIDNREKLIDNIKDLLKAVDNLNKITVDTSNIRLDIDRALRMVEVR